MLDTNVPSETLRPKPARQVAAWLAAQALDDLYLSVVSCGELLKGIHLLTPGKRRIELEHWYNEAVLERFSGRILPVTKAIAERWGELEAAQQKRGRSMQVADAQIAATALEHKLHLVTRNVKHFEGLAISLINPWDES